MQDIEKNLMKQDAERDERRAKNNRPAVVAQGLEMNDASGVRRRGKMMLPAPQVTSYPMDVTSVMHSTVNLLLSPVILLLSHKCQYILHLPLIHLIQGSCGAYHLCPERCL